MRSRQSGVIKAAPRVAVVLALGCGGAAFCDEPCKVVCPPGAVQESEVCRYVKNNGCEALYSCAGPSGNCCHGLSSAGCGDPVCASSVCSYDPFCCDFLWDNICGSEACNDPNCQCDPISSDPYMFVNCGDTICGTLWDDTDDRDSDWYRFWVYEAGDVISATIDAEFDVAVVLAKGDCAAETPALGVGQCPTTVTFTVEVPGDYILIIEPYVSEAVTCEGGSNHYVIHLTCPLPTCPPDVTGNGIVDVDDLLVVINSWGPCDNPKDCPADVAPPDGNGVVDVDDLLEIINHWGPCAP